MNSEWIESNLPWRHEEPSENYPKYPDFSEREKEVFGISLKEAAKNIGENYGEEKDLTSDFYIFSKLKNELYNILDSNSYSDDEVEKITNEYWNSLSDNKSVRNVLAFKDLKNKIVEWSELQPEVLEYRKKYEEFLEEMSKKSFTGQKLNISGTLIELENGNQYLIGCINELGGICNDCTGFEDNSIIKRYKIVFDCNCLVKNKD